jgi:hypothetical protein
MDDRKRATFLRGILLAWLPCVLLLIPASRWTGDAAFLPASRVLYAIPILPCEVAALFFLLRSFSRTHTVRTVITGISVLWSVALIIVMMGAVSSAISGAFA